MQRSRQGGGLYHGGDRKDKYRGYCEVGVVDAGRLSEASSVSLRCRAMTSAPAFLVVQRFLCFCSEPGTPAVSTIPFNVYS